MQRERLNPVQVKSPQEHNCDEIRGKHAVLIKCWIGPAVPTESSLLQSSVRNLRRILRIASLPHHVCDNPDMLDVTC